MYQQMPHRSRLIIAALGLTTAQSTFATTFPQSFETIALTGGQVPGAVPGVIFQGFETPSLNALGEVAFIGDIDITSPGVNTPNDRGVYKGLPGFLSEVVREGDQAPGSLPGVVFRYLEDVSINAMGDLIFFGDLVGTGVVSANDRGLYTTLTGPLTEVVREGAQAPNAPAGAVFRTLSDPVFSSSGHIVFDAGLIGTDIERFINGGGIYMAGAGPLEELARSGAQAPGAPDGLFLRGYLGTVVNASGQVAGQFWLRTEGDDFPSIDSVYTISNGTLSLELYEGGPAPGQPAGVEIVSLGNPVINHAGQISFRGAIAGVGVDLSNDRVLYSGTPGALSEVAREGEQAPGAAPGAVFEAFSNTTIDASGGITFRVQLTGTGIDGSNNSGLYTNRSGVLTKIVQEGDDAPGTGNGIQFGSIGSQLMGNASGQIVFSTNVVGSGVDSTNDGAIYATDRTGALVLIAREGDLLDVDNDLLIQDLRTIASVSVLFDSGTEDGRPISFNDLGQVAFHASFTDGTEGVFISNIATVPEPGSLLILLGGASMLGRRRRV